METLDCLKRPALQGGRLIGFAQDSLEPVTGPVANGGASPLSGAFSAALAGNEEARVFRNGIDIGAAADPWVMKRMNFGAASLSKRRGRAPHFTSASTLQSGAGRFSFM